MNHNLDHKSGLSREKWLELAVQAMSRECKTKFSLDSLIEAMPVSKGSFYWHFKDRADFLAALVEYWDRKDTQSVIDALENLPESASAADKLWELMCIVYEMDFGRYDLLIRSLALEFPNIREAVQTVDRKRLNTVRMLFSELGFKGDELEMRVLAFVSTTSMEGIVFSELSTEAYERQLKLRHEFFIRH